MAFGIWLAWLSMDLFLPALMIGLGVYISKHPPGKINGFYGYRTSMSMKNQDTWDFAQRHSASVLRKWGMWSLLTLVPMGVVIGCSLEVMATVSCIVLVAQIVVLLCSICPTERALKETFDSYGNRKH